jgi:hypothetical protein
MKLVDKAIRILIMLALIILVVSLAANFLTEHWHR